METASQPRLAGFGPCTLATCLLLDCTAAQATGFFVNQQSVRGLGRVNAGVAAAADDASTVYFNPAGLPELPAAGGTGNRRNMVTVGLHLIRPSYHFSNQGSVAATPGTAYEPVPYAGANSGGSPPILPVVDLYLTRRITERGYIGFGANSPFGLSAKYDADWFGRYDAIEASLRTINLSLVGAYEINDYISIGGGIDVQYAKTRLTSAIPNVLVLGGPSAATDARSEVTGDTWTPGFNLGLMLKPFGDTDTRIGLTYRSGFTHDLSGEVETTGFSGPFAAFNEEADVNADLKLPAIASLGLYHNIKRQNGKALALFGQIDWMNWSRFDEIRIRYKDGRPDQIRPENYRDTWSVSVGADWSLSEKLVLRGGLRFDQTPTVDSDRDTIVPDETRYWLGLGVTYRSSENLSFDVAFTHVWFDQAKVDVTREFPLASSVRVRSEVDTHVNTLAAGLSYAF